MKTTRLQSRLALRQRTESHVLVTSTGILMAGSNTGELGARQIRRLAGFYGKKSTNEKAAFGEAASSKNKGKSQT